MIETRTNDEGFDGFLCCQRAETHGSASTASYGSVADDAVMRPTQIANVASHGVHRNRGGPWLAMTEIVGLDHLLVGFGVWVGFSAVLLGVLQIRGWRATKAAKHANNVVHLRGQYARGVPPMSHAHGPRVGADAERVAAASTVLRYPTKGDGRRRAPST
jgi:hypothetical protein